MRKMNVVTIAVGFICGAGPWRIQNIQYPGNIRYERDHRCTAQNTMGVQNVRS